MGRKVHPIGFRLGIIKDWDSKWFAEGDEFSRRVIEDAEIRSLIRDRLGRAGISRIGVERYASRIAITIQTAKPGMVIGRRGATINALLSELRDLTDMDSNRLRVDVVELERPELDARVIAESLAEQVERRVSYRRALRQALRRTMRAGAEGVKIACKGRLSGAEMAREVWQREGRVPLHTLRADIDFAIEEAETSYGRIGIKVWVYRGDVLPEVERLESQRVLEEVGA